MYNFKWEPKDGLKYIDNEMYNMARLLATKLNIDMDKDLYFDTDGDGNKTSGPQVRFTINNMKCFCGDEKNVTTECFMKHAIETEKNCSDSIEFKMNLNSNKYADPDCYSCVYGNNCIYPYVAYIKYLIEEGLSERIKADRDFYRENKTNIEKMLQEENAMQYELKANLMLDTPDDYLELAEMIQSYGAVSIASVLNEKECYLVNSILKHDERDHYQDLEKIRADILDNKLSWENVGLFDYSTFDTKSIYKSYTLEALAAYIDYLKKTGKYSEYLENRRQRLQKTEKEFENYCNTVPGMQKILAVAETDTESSLYYVIEGERGVGKEKLVKNIATYLNQKGMIHSSDYICTTFEEMAISLGYMDREVGEHDRINEYMHYDGFESHKLYVLTDLKEFLYSAKGHTEGDGSKYSHLIKLLGRYQSDTYIIVIGEKKYVDKFLKLSASINFNFGKNVIHLDNLSTDNLYDAYMNKLSENLRNQLSENEQFKNVFEQYIEKNRRAMPLENQELASYLANYSNLHKELVLPPYAYQSKTAEEMLQSVIGMNNVKKTMAEFKKYAIFTKIARDEGVAVPNSNMHMIFTGNPGTGKTMIARVVGQMLFELGLVEENKVIEVEPRQLISTYVGESAKKTATYVDKAMGGVLFIDEAYAIGNNTCGKEVIATLIKSMEDYKDKFVVIFAGYDKEMHEFLNINSGIASRIGYNFRFEDYSGKELMEIFNVKMKNAGFIYEDEVLSEVKELTEHFSGKRNFGNGRFVDKVIQRTLLKHAINLEENGDPKRIKTDDIPSIEEMISTDVIEQTDFEYELSQFIGLETVKEKVRQFASYVEFQQAAKQKGAIIPAGNMHMVFTGNPGTGKTTIARVMVNLLYSIGVIKERKLVEVERKDLVAEHVGQTAIKTNEVIERAMNGVLFVDEAYSLAGGSKGDFGGEAIATLIKAMEDHKDELIVIFAGYKDEMRTFLKMNSGIESRIGYTFHFEDYSVNELLQIYLLRMNQMQFVVEENAKDKLKNVCEYFCKKPNFGNGRFVDRLVQETLVMHSNRIKGDEAQLLIICQDDIPDIADINNTSKTISSTDELSKIIGMDGVKEKLHEFEDMVNFSVQAREIGITIPNLNFHMLFTGNPGTGKTTIARIITQKLYDIGVIMENKLIEVERKDLVAGYVGQTAIKTSEAIEKAMGGVLFIDEAYTLTPKHERDFGGEAIATLIKAMEDHKDDLIVIFAGYKDEMAEFVDSNPGIASRLGFAFDFEDYNAEQLVEIFVRKMKGCGFTIEDSAIPALLKIMTAFSGTTNFGNGRFVDKVIQNTILKHAKRHLTTNLDIIDALDIPTEDELKKTMNNMQEEHKVGF